MILFSLLNLNTSVILIGVFEKLPWSFLSSLMSANLGCLSVLLLPNPFHASHLPVIQ